MMFSNRFATLGRAVRRRARFLLAVHAERAGRVARSTRSS